MNNLTRLLLIALLGTCRMVQGAEENSPEEPIAAQFDVTSLETLIRTEPNLANFAIEASDSIQDNKERASTLIKIAGLYADAGVSNLALSALNRLQDIIPQLKPEDQPWYLWRSANLYTQLGKSNEGIRLLKEAEQAIPNTNTIDTAEFNTRIAISYAEAGQVEQALRSKEIALEQTSRIESINDRLELLLQLHLLTEMSIVLLQQQSDTNIESILNCILTFETKCTNSNEWALHLSYFTDKFREKGFPEPAFTLLEHFDDKIILENQLCDMVDTCTTKQQINRILEIAVPVECAWNSYAVHAKVAEYYADKGMLDQAISMIEQIEDEYSQSESWSMIAEAYAKTGDASLAIHYSQCIQDTSERARAQIRIYSILDVQGKSQEAKKARKLALKSAEISLYAGNLCDMATILIGQENMKEARKLLKMAEKNTQKQDSASLRVSYFVDLAEIYLRLNDQETAEDLLDQALVSAEEMTDYDKLSKLKWIARALARAGHVREAADITLPFLSKESDRDSLLRTFAENASSLDDFNLIIENRKEIRDDYTHDWLIRDLVDRGIEIGRMDLAAQAAKVQRSEYSREDRFKQISNAYAENRNFRSAIDTALCIERASPRFDQLTKIAKGCFMENQPMLCAEAISLISKPGEQIQAIAELACLNN